MNNKGERGNVEGLSHPFEETSAVVTFGQPETREHPQNVKARYLHLSTTFRINEPDTYSCMRDTKSLVEALDLNSDLVTPAARIYSDAPTDRQKISYG